MIRATCPWVVLLGSGCVFITADDRQERAELLAGVGDSGDGAPTTLLGDDDDDDGYGDDDDDDDDDGPAGVAGAWRTVAVGGWVSCAADTVGDLSCWSTDEVGDWYPPMPKGLDVRGVAAGLDVACAWDDTGDTRCFGQPRGTDNNPEAAILERPGTFDVGSVSCGASTCCGLQGGALSCWDADGMVTPTSGLDEATARRAVSVWGGGCTLGDDDALDCFSFTSTGGTDPGAPFDGSDIDAVDVGEGGYACARAVDDSVGCWNVSGSSSFVETMDVPAGTELADLHALDNGGTPYVCGLAGGAVACYGVAGFGDPPASGAPSGNWTALSMRGDVGCVLAGDELSCWGTGDHRPR